MNNNGQAAAFYDLEGTLVSTNLVHTLGFYAQRQQGLWQTAKKSVGTLAKLPFFGITDLYSRNVFNEVFFRSYEGFSHDRLRYFSDELFEEVLKPAIFPGTPELIAVWKDPEFDPAARAFYYARVLEIPTPRWTAYDAAYFKVKMDPKVPMTTQERARQKDRPTAGGADWGIGFHY